MKKMTRKTRRISARLAPKAYQMVEEMSAVTGQSVSSVLERSIQSYHKIMIAGRREPWKLLKKTGLINSGAGDRNLSDRYKNLLPSSLIRKH
jgi:hypothetical protein